MGTGVRRKMMFKEEEEEPELLPETHEESHRLLERRAFD
jgi:hypothetical protein